MANRLAPAFWLALTLAAAQAAVAAPPGPGFVTRKGPALFRDGKPYRAIGVNIPHLSQTYFGTWFHIEQIYGTPERAKQAMLAALDDAARSGIAFVRFFASPGYPRDTDLIYAKDRDAYWRRMDQLVAECRRRRIGLVPSLHSVHGWYAYCGERAQAILDPSSKTYKATHQYIREFVARYRDEPTILMWEMENEAMLAADVDMAGSDLLPRAVYSPGAQVREKGVREDSLTWDMILRIYREQAAFIKGLDPNHLVTSGDASTRPECTSRRETFPDFRYRNDTLREMLANNLASQPEPLDVASYHFYGAPVADEPWKLWGLSAAEMVRALARATQAARVPVFFGEFGQMKPSFAADHGAAWTVAGIDALEQEGVSLAAIWVWHFPWQPDLTVSSATHPALTRRIARFNRLHAGLK